MAYYYNITILVSNEFVNGCWRSTIRLFTLTSICNSVIVLMLVALVNVRSTVLPHTAHRTVRATKIEADGSETPGRC